MVLENKGFQSGFRATSDVFNNAFEKPNTALRVHFQASVYARSHCSKF